MTDDIHRVLAEKKLGRRIPDEEWTPERRRRWKAYNFSDLYGTKVGFLAPEGQLIGTPGQISARTLEGLATWLRPMLPKGDSRKTRAKFRAVMDELEAVPGSPCFRDAVRRLRALLEDER